MPSIATEYLKDIIEKLQDEYYSDVVKVVRCRDCARYDTHDKRCRYWNHGVGVDLDGYCSKAERRTDEPRL